MYRWQIMQRIAEQHVIAIIRATSPQSALQRAEACLAAGLGAIEISLNTPGALDTISHIREASPDTLIGAGTVLDPAAAHLAVVAGARFLICPTLDPGVIAAGHRHGAAVIPGAATPTEIVTALTAGADAIKLFPASAHTPETLAGILQALPQAPIIPTGGITLNSAIDWLHAGAVAVGIGTSLTSGDIAANTAQLLAATSINQIPATSAGQPR